MGTYFRDGEKGTTSSCIGPTLAEMGESFPIGKSRADGARLLVGQLIGWLGASKEVGEVK